MANTKISALSSASTPLSGSEIVPINQSGTTDSVSVANLTAGRAVSMLSANIGNASSQNSVFNTVVGSASATNSGVVIVTGSTGKGWLGFNNANNASIPGQVTYNFSTNVLDFYSSGTYTFSNGDVTLSIGNLVQGTAGKGINFTANTPASGMTSQNLNWYEEGTWTPTYFGLTTAGTTTYGVNKGTYVRVGRLVTVTGVMTWTAATGTGGAALGGLPFNIYNGAGEADGSVWIGTESGYTMTGQLGAFLIRGGNYAWLQVYNAGSSSAASVINGSAALRFSFSYPCN